MPPKLSKVGTSTWNAESSSSMPRNATMRLFEAPQTMTRPKAKPSYVAKAGSSSSRPLSGVTSPAATKRSSGTSSGSSQPPQVPVVGKEAFVPFQRTTVMAQRKMMTQALKKETFTRDRERSLRSDHVNRHLGGPESSKDEPIDATYTPSEVLARGPRAHVAFLEALRYGKVRPRTLKLMFVGQGRAGKTSTLKAMTGQLFDSEEPSTHGLATSLPVVQTKGAASSMELSEFMVSNWSVLDRAEKEIHDEELGRSMARFVAGKLREEESSGEMPSGPPQPSEVERNISNESEHNFHFQVPEASSKMPVDLVAKLIENEDDFEEPVTLKTWDFGGQQEYYVMHHLFLTTRAVYLVVTRLDGWLGDKLEGDPDEGVEEAFDPPLEALTFWLSSIHIHAPDAIVVIVGTHLDAVRDRFQGDHERIQEVQDRVDEEIGRLLEKVPGVERQIVVNDDAGRCFFPVDNSVANDQGIATLRCTIDRIAMDALAEDGPFGEPLPLRWVQFREKLEDIAEGNTGDSGILPITATFVLPYHKAVEYAKEVGIRKEQELNLCLQYLHDIGSVVFFDEPGLSDWVVLSTQWLADAMAHILNCPRVVQGSVNSARRLREKGELEMPLLQKHLWKAPKFQQHMDVLLKVLHRFDLLMPAVPSSPSQTANGVACSYFVPVLLPKATEIHDGGVLWGALYFDFHGMLCRLLPTLFPKLLVASSRQPGTEVMNTLGMFRDSFRIVWGGQQIAMDIVPADRPQVLRVYAMAESSEADSGLSVETVRSLLDLIRTALTQHNHLTFTAGILCEHCHAKGRRQSQRHHVIDLNDILSEKVIACRIQHQVVKVPEESWVARWRAEAQLSSESVVHNDQTSYTEESVDSIHTLPSFGSEGAPSIPSSVSASTVQSPRQMGASTGFSRPMVRLLYASPLYRSDGREAGEVPPLDFRQELSLLGEATSNVLPIQADLATAANLQELLMTSQDGRLALHLSLHCCDGGRQLLFEDANGGAHSITMSDLDSLLTATTGTQAIRLLFINACFSEAAGRRFVGTGAPHVVCCRGAVFDAAARCFARTFYMALCAGAKTIGAAFDIAKATLRTSPQVGLRGEADKYLLLPETEKHDVTLKDLLGVSGGHNTIAPTANNWMGNYGQDLPGKIEDFCGRSRDLWVVLQQLGSGRRCLQLCGAEQVGKTALLVELARFVSAPGRCFSGAIWYISCSSILSVKAEQDNPLKINALVGAIYNVVTSGDRLEEDDMLECDDPVGLDSDVRHMRSRIIRTFKAVESTRGALLILDDLDMYLEHCLEDLRKVLTEIILRTQRTVILIGSCNAAFQALGSHKAVAYQLQQLQPQDAAKLFLWRVHRPLMLADLSSETSSDLPVIFNAQNRGMVLQQLANHPLLVFLNGHPGRVRSAAEKVLPGGPSLWEIHRQLDPFAGRV